MLNIELAADKSNASVATCKQGPLSPTAPEIAEAKTILTASTAFAPPIFSARQKTREEMLDNEHQVTII